MTRPDTFDFTIVYYNAGDGGPRLKGADLATLAQGYGADVIVGAEMGDQQDAPGIMLRILRAAYRRTRARRKATELPAPSWRTLWDPSSNAGRKTPIMVNTARLRVGRFRLPVTRRLAYLGPKGAGPDRGDEKRLAVAVLRPRGVKRVRLKVLGHHMTASAFSTGGAEGDRRLAAWRKQRDAFTREVDTTPEGTLVFGGGDWNAEPGYPELEPRHMPWSWTWDLTAPTKGSRLIDFGGHRRSPRIVVTGRGVVRGTSSDHDHPYVRYRVTARKRRRVAVRAARTVLGS